MNKVILMGRLTRDPEVRYAQSKPEMEIATYTLAVRKRKFKNNEAEAEFIDVVAFYKDAELAEKYLKKGRMVVVSGSLHKDIWEDAEHNKHTKVEVIVDEQYFTSGCKQVPEEVIIHNAASEIASSTLQNLSFNKDEMPY